MNDARTAIEAVWRIESARVLGALMRMVRELGMAEELAQEALVAALETWPETGIPQNPGAWLVTTAKRRAIDELRRRKMAARKHDELAHTEPESAFTEPDIATADEAAIDDDILRLMLIACHPVLSTEARAALTLRVLGGLTTDEIARAFLQPEPTIAQRIVRAKRTLAAANVPFELPARATLVERVASVLEVIYLVYNEGYAATKGDDWMRPALCEDALRLGRMLANLVPDDAEVHGLLALMQLQSSRTRARTAADGTPILLLEQNRALWDQRMIGSGLQALARAESLRQPLGPYTLQAAIAACHARARTAADTDWPRIVALYDALVEVTQSPVAALNRAVAVAMAFGPAAGLELLDELADEPSLESYHLLPSVRGDFLQKLGRQEEARTAFEQAAGLAKNTRERELLLAKARAAASTAH